MEHPTMTILAALVSMTLVVLVIEATALLFRATLPKDARPATDWHPLATGTDRIANQPPRAA
jgi:hypothetical protein